MITVDRLVVAAPLADVFACAGDVERWPQWLPHYRWVRILSGPSAGAAERTATVEMAAWRPFGPLRWPTWWISEMTIEPRVPRVRYRHVRGITRGMDVAWEFAERDGGTEVTITHWWDGPRWPLIGALAANLIIGPVFIHGIASRTLAGIGRAAARRGASV